jgi:putative phosphoesterase
MEGGMRIAIVADIHGNLTALEAVVADLRQTSPDLVLHGGDLADAGANPARTVDRIRDLGWQGVMGNTDEMLFRPDSLKEFASQSPDIQPLLVGIEEMAEATREALGEERLAWLRSLPLTQIQPPMALMHASPATAWRAPAEDASDAELESVYAPLGQPIAIYAHVHHPFVRTVSGMIVANTGSVGLSYDGDRRASYLLLDEFDLIIRRVDYDVAKEIQALSVCGLPHAAWVARMLESGSFEMP